MRTEPRENPTGEGPRGGPYRAGDGQGQLCHRRFRDREDDIIWRVRWADGWCYVYLLIEFQSDEPTWLAVYARLLKLVDTGALDSLKRAFGRWIYRSFIRKKRPGIRLPDINDFQEVHIMLQQWVERWNAEIRERGRQEGRQEGLVEACREMVAALLERTALDDAAIADLAGLSREAIRALRNTPTEH
ncbi:hypothetical protein [uncultured Thiodictyon sp.]|uniref:hypothetical protein n=1 Tax=uncultured Thiodictyon sp. TaxID=1846217 RepID=UPI0025D7271F|nr:hypothetical protein [uncultured Thiodictyon sp.]